MNSQPYSFTTGDTDPVGDCGKFEAGITVGEWLQRIVVYGSTPADAEALRDQLMTDSLYLRGALEHIQKTVGQSRTQTRRLRWIGKRAELALAGWHQGHTLTSILEELRLISWHRPSGKIKVTAKGRHYIWLAFKGRPGV